MKTIKIRDRLVGSGQPVFLIAEIGINHNGDLGIAKRLIDVASETGWDAVKFQKRTVDTVYSSEELARSRESPFGKTNGDLKRGLEFGQKEYEEIDSYCQKKGIMWFASCWDMESVDFIEQFNPPCHKIASACITDHSLLKKISATGRPVIMSTGMSDHDMIQNALEALNPTPDIIIMHCVATYPARLSDLNLLVIPELAKKYELPVGYSGHEVGLSTSIAAVSLGACVVERHVTLDRTMYGSDQAASVEPSGMRKLVQEIRDIQIALGVPEKTILECEIPVIKKLRRV